MLVPKSQTNPAWDVVLDLDAVGAGTLHERLKRALRAAIRSGRLATGATLPPSRALAADLGCSRWAVTEAYAQLTAEGYLEARTGSGTRVRWVDTGRAARRRRARGPAVRRSGWTWPPACPTFAPSHGRAGPRRCGPSPPTPP